MCQLKNIKRSCTVKSTPGLKTKIFYIEKDDIDIWPTNNVAPVAAGDSVKLVGNFTLLAGKEWKYITATINKGSLKTTMQGEPGSGFENIGKFAITGNDPGAVEFANCINSPCEKVFLLETREGYYRVLGTENEGCNAKSIDLDTGEKPGDFNGGVYEFSSYGEVAYFYQGTITPIQA